MAISQKQIEKSRHNLINSVSGTWKILTRPGNKYNVHYEETLLAEEVTGRELYHICSALRRFNLLMSRDQDIKNIYKEINEIKKRMETTNTNK